MSYHVGSTKRGAPKTVFASNGVANPPSAVSSVNHPSSKLYKSGFRLLPSETADIPKTVSVRHKDSSVGRKNILHPRVNISDDAFNASLTHMNPDRVQEPVHPPMGDFTRDKGKHVGTEFRRVRKSQPRKPLKKKSKRR